MRAAQPGRPPRPAPEQLAAVEGDLDGPPSCAVETQASGGLTPPDPASHQGADAPRSPGLRQRNLSGACELRDGQGERADLERLTFWTTPCSIWVGASR